jgi:diguanylate cyclase
VLSTAPSTQGRRWWKVFAVAGVLATALYTLNLAPAVNGTCFAVIGVGTVWACFAAPRRFGA